MLRVVFLRKKQDNMTKNTIANHFELCYVYKNRLPNHT